MSRVELHGVRLAYGDRAVLRDVDLTIGEGERIALIGPNGAGKSTLLRCLAGVAPERRGAVLLDGIPIEELSRETVARRMAVVPQEATLPFSASVEAIVGLGRIPHEHPFLGPGEADRAAVARAIERVGLSEIRERDGRSLSAGERQLVLIALALAQSTGLVVLDEPTIHLDLHHQVRVMELLRDLNERDGTTIVAVLHDLALAAHFFPRLILLDAGRLVLDGPPEDVLLPDVIRSVFRVDPALVRR